MKDSKLRRLRDFTSGPATLISEGCKITGTISGNGDYMISGEVDGDAGDEQQGPGDDSESQPASLCFWKTE
jgi:hypothetical protein